MRLFSLLALVLLLALAGCQPNRVEWLAAPPDGEVAPLVQRELARAKADHKKLLVYVGASWCEPCRRFHEAVTAGQLDPQFAALRFLEFDFDRDEARLRQAGYVSRLIPLFALPSADGRASGRQMEGSIKGPGAVGEITPRLRALTN